MPERGRCGNYRAVEWTGKNVKEIRKLVTSAVAVAAHRSAYEVERSGGTLFVSEERDFLIERGGLIATDDHGNVFFQTSEEHEQMVERERLIAAVVDACDTGLLYRICDAAGVLAAFERDRLKDAEKTEGD